MRFVLYSALALATALMLVTSTGLYVAYKTLVDTTVTPTTHAPTINNTLGVNDLLLTVESFTETILHVTYPPTDGGVWTVTILDPTQVKLTKPDGGVYECR